MKHIVVIGGGAAGLTSAIHAKRKNNTVTVLEKNPICGKKILATGNGRCNYWNTDQDLVHYHSTNEDILKEIINPVSQSKVLNFFDQLGIYPKIKNGYYYPSSNQASTIKEALITEVHRLGINIKTSFPVLKIEKINNYFKIYSDQEVIKADKVIMAMGSIAAPKTGSTGDGYNLLKNFGHTIIPPHPSLVQLRTKGDYLKDWSGVRTDAKVSLYIDNKLIKEEVGEIQLTDYGISGICVFNISRYVSKALNQTTNIKVKINFLPFIKNDVEAFFDNYFMNKPHRSLERELSGFLNQKLIPVILNDLSIPNSTSYSNLTSQAKTILLDRLTNFTIEVIATNDFNHAQVASGGLSLTEINLQTMESTLIKDLYVVGELLDVDGDCGGYNLGFAWLSAIKAGEGCEEDD